MGYPLFLSSREYAAHSYRVYSCSAKCTCDGLERKEENRFMDVQLRRSWRFLTTYLKLFFCPITSRSRRDEEFPMHPFQALNRNLRLLAHYLRPQWPRMGLLAVIL